MWYNWSRPPPGFIDTEPDNDVEKGGSLGGSSEEEDIQINLLDPLKLSFTSQNIREHGGYSNNDFG